MSKIIICIHGLGNKVPQPLLKTWWKRSVREGLKGIDRPRLNFHFELVYWADVLHPRPLDPNEENKNAHLYLEDPYFPGRLKRPPEPGGFGRKMMNYIEDQLDNLFLNNDMSLNFSSITDKIIRRYFKDLEAYFSQTAVKTGEHPTPAKDIIRRRLSDALRRHKNKDILLIAHSMGSVIAYDVLTRSVPGIEINTVVTLGSPLGLPVIVSRIFSEQGRPKASTQKINSPDAIRKKWYNFSDIEDKVALDHTLADDYGANIHQVRPNDQLVFNNYEANGKRNPHKSYGYLRAPEVASVIDEFLRGRRFSWWQNRTYAFNRWVYGYIDKIKKF